MSIPALFPHSCCHKRWCLECLQYLQGYPMINVSLSLPLTRAIEGYDVNALLLGHPT
jgi:hypothetical protein